MKQKKDRLVFPELNHRIQQLVDELAGGNVAEFVRMSKISSHQVLNRIFSIDGRTGKYPKPSADILTNIKVNLPNVNYDWLLTGEGDMLKSGSVVQHGDHNVQVQGNKADTVAVAMNGGTINHNGSKDKVIETQWQQVNHMFKAMMDELHGFHEISRRRDVHFEKQDEHFVKQDEYISSIVKHSYLRNRENMERIDKLIDQQNQLLRMVIDQSTRTQERADRLIDMLIEFVNQVK